MPVLSESLSNQIHLHNIISCISEIEDVVDHESFESFSQDEEIRMTVYRTLMMLGIEASNVQKSNLSKRLSLDPLMSMKYADFINKLGKEYYAVYNFITNDLPFYKKAIEVYLKGLTKAGTFKKEQRTRLAV